MVCCQHHCLIKAEQVLPRCTVCCMCRAALLNPNTAAKQPQTKSMRQKLTRKERFVHEFSDIQFCIGDSSVVNEYGLCLIVIERRVSFLWIRTLYQRYQKACDRQVQTRKGRMHWKKCVGSVEKLRAKRKGNQNVASLFSSKQQRTGASPATKLRFPCLA